MTIYAFHQGKDHADRAVSPCLPTRGSSQAMANNPPVQITSTISHNRLTDGEDSTGQDVRKDTRRTLT